MARQTSPATVLPRRRLLHHRMTGGGDGGRRWCPPHQQRLGLAGHRRGDGKGRRKGLWGWLRRAVPSRRQSPGCHWLLFFKAGLPAAGSAKPAAAPPHAVSGGAGGSPSRQRAGQRHELGAALIRRGDCSHAEEQQQVPPAALNYSCGVYYIRSHKLEPLCNAI